MEVKEAGTMGGRTGPNSSSAGSKGERVKSDKRSKQKR